MLFLSSLSGSVKQFCMAACLRLVNLCCVMGERRAFLGVSWRKDGCGLGRDGRLINELNSWRACCN
jgi:hypothetical protein